MDALALVGVFLAGAQAVFVARATAGAFAIAMRGGGEEGGVGGHRHGALAVVEARLVVASFAKGLFGGVVQGVEGEGRVGEVAGGVIEDGGSVLDHRHWLEGVVVEGLELPLVFVFKLLLMMCGCRRLRLRG